MTVCSFKRKTLIGSGFCFLHHSLEENVYQELVKCTSEVGKQRDCDYQCGPCQKIDYQRGEQEGSGCQLPGEDGLTSQLPLSVILSSW